jgi:hypothetical protein
MQRTFAFLVVVLGLLSPGCTVIQDGVRVANTSLMDQVDDVCERHRNRNLAETAWRQLAGSGPCEYSAAHHHGFVDGFADYLFWGKTEPPIVPPAHYRGFSYQNPQGYKAIEDWFTGYRHGVAMAIDSGYRRLVTGPISTVTPAGPDASFLPLAAINKSAIPEQPASRPVEPILPAAQFGIPAALDANNPNLPWPPVAVGKDNEDPPETPKPVRPSGPGSN